MKLYAYTMYDKKIKVYGSIQFTKECPDDLKVAYERQAVKDTESVKKCKDNILYYIGIFDDNTGLLNQVDKQVVIDFDSLILEVVGVKDE